MSDCGAISNIMSTHGYEVYDFLDRFIITYCLVILKRPRIPLLLD